MDVEFNAIQTAVESKADLNSPTFTGTPAAPTAASGTSSTQLATTAFVASATTDAVPPGSVTMYAGSSAPSGYLLCTGQAVSRTTYSALYAAIGTAFGTGDGSTTFNVPDLKNRLPIGAGDLYSLAGTGGSKDAVVVSHNHSASSSVSDPGHTHSVPEGAVAPGGGSSYASGDDITDSLQTNSTSGASGTGISVSTTVNSAGVSGTGANLPPYLSLNFIIKT